MATTIKLKNGSGAPLAGDLVQGEPAFDLTNKRLYTEDSGGTVIEVGTNPTSLTTGTFTSTGIDDNATSTAITITGGNDLGIGVVSPRTGYRVDIQESADNGVNIQAGNASSDIALAVGSASTADKFVIQSGGNVGVGTASPAQALDVVGTIKGDSTFLLSNATTSSFLQVSTNIFQFGTSSSDPVAFYANNSEHMRITGTGNVGIGTSSPDAPLTVFGGGVAEFRVGNFGPSSNSAIRISRNDPTVSSGNPLGYLEFGSNDATGSTDTAFAYVSAEAEGTFGAGDNPTALTFAVTADGTSSPSEAMRIDNSGNVGIGQSSPAYPLDVKAGSGTFTAVNIEAPSDTGLSHVFFSDSANAIGRVTYDHANNAMSFMVNNATTAYINSSGRVGIGETNPDGLLHLTGDTNANGAELFLQVNNNNTTDNLGAIHFGNNTDSTLSRILSGTSGTSTSSYLTFATSSSGTISEAMRIDSSGNVGIGLASPAKQLHLYSANSGGNITE